MENNYDNFISNAAIIIHHSTSYSLYITSSTSVFYMDEVRHTVKLHYSEHGTNFAIVNMRSVNDKNNVLFLSLLFYKKNFSFINVKFSGIYNQWIFGT